jgi:hypothetical protein
MHFCNTGGLDLVVVHHFLVGEDLSEPHLQTFKFWRSGWSGTMRWGVLERGILTETARPSPLGELLGLSGGSPAWTDGTGRFTVLGALFMSFTHHDLQGEVGK